MAVINMQNKLYTIQFFSPCNNWFTGSPRAAIAEHQTREFSQNSWTSKDSNSLKREERRASSPSPHHGCRRPRAEPVGTTASYTSVPATSASIHDLGEVQQPHDLRFYVLLPEQMLNSGRFLIHPQLKSGLVKQFPWAGPAPFSTSQLSICPTVPRSTAPFEQKAATPANVAEMLRTS